LLLTQLTLHVAQPQLIVGRTVIPAWSKHLIHKGEMLSPEQKSSLGILSVSSAPK